MRDASPAREPSFLSPLVTPVELAAHLSSSTLRVVDCRFSLADPKDGFQRYSTAHIPGAVYAHLNDDLSGPKVSGRTGRHPLPAPVDLANKLGLWGISNESFVVAYDQNDGSMAAARLWWLLNYLGHARVAVLNGGFDAWLALGLPTEDGPARDVRAASFVPHVNSTLLASRDDVARVSSGGTGLLLDARAEARFTGEVEPIDARKGHIPGAHNLPYASLTQSGSFLDTDELKTRLTSALGTSDVQETIAYCGSGVTACHLLLGAAAAGVRGARLYAGSFSEWIVDPTASVETGRSSG
jgi:thiosulfate/3-mercaptopyruvate sulfurtransferase